MTDALLVALLKTPSLLVQEALAALPAAVQWVAVRADQVGDLSPDSFRQAFRGRWLYTLRSHAEGGHSKASFAERQQRLTQAATTYDLIDLEAERDLSPEILRAIPPEKRMISWHGPPTDRTTLRARFERMAGIPARFYKLAPAAQCASDGLAPLAFLKALARPDVIAFATGPRGLWSRLLAPYLGAPLVFGTMAEVMDGEGDPPLQLLIQDYGLPTLRPLDALYGIVGSPVTHSLSPRLHNAAYRALDQRALYLSFEVDAFPSFWHTMVEDKTLASMGFPVGGLTVVSPHKPQAQQIIPACSLITQRALSSNLYVRQNGSWHADTTDASGIYLTLGRHGVGVAGKRIAIIGCGGSGRAMAVALDQAGAHVTLVNRSLDRGYLAAQLLDLPFVPLATFTPTGFDILINATPVGRHGDTLPFPVDTLNENAVVVDLVYGSRPTPLVTRTRARGRRAIDGREMLLVQVMRQFALMTGQEMPETLVRHLIGLQPAAAPAPV